MILLASAAILFAFGITLYTAIKVGQKSQAMQHLSSLVMSSDSHYSISSVEFSGSIPKESVAYRLQGRSGAQILNESIKSRHPSHQLADQYWPDLKDEIQCIFVMDNGGSVRVVMSEFHSAKGIAISYELGVFASELSYPVFIALPSDLWERQGGAEGVAP